MLKCSAELDRSDPLKAFRSQFVIEDPDLIYLDGNSLGRMPQAAAERAQEVVSQQWGEGLVQRYEGDKMVVLFDQMGYKTLAVDIVLENHLLEAAP